MLDQHQLALREHASLAAAFAILEAQQVRDLFQRKSK